MAIDAQVQALAACSDQGIVRNDLAGLGLMLLVGNTGIHSTGIRYRYSLLTTTKTRVEVVGIFQNAHFNSYSNLCAKVLVDGWVSCSAEPVDPLVVACCNCLTCSEGPLAA